MTTPEQARRKRRGRWITWSLIALFAVLIVGVPAYLTLGPDPPIRVSKETTHLTAPLTPEGMPDYAAAMLADMRKGVTPENNGAVLFMQAMWDELTNEASDDWSAEGAKRVSDEIGAPCPPPLASRGSSWYSRELRPALVGIYRSRMPAPTENSTPFEYRSNSFNGTVDERTFWELSVEEAGKDGRVEDLFDLVRDRPWTSDDLPCFAEWVEQNRASLDLLVDAAERPQWYLPSVGMLLHDGDPSNFLPAFMSLRDASRRLTIRINHALGEGRHPEAVRDTAAILRLGRHGCRDPFLVSQMVGSAVHGIGMANARQIANGTSVPAPALRRLLTELQAAGPGTIDLKRSSIYERYYGLASMIHDGRAASADYVWSEEEVDSIESLKHFSIDWNEVLVAINEHYDALDAAMRQPTPDQVLAAVRQIDALTAARSAANQKVWDHPEELLTPAQRGRAIANQVMGSSLLDIEHMLFVDKLARSRYDLTLLSVALAVWRAENGGAYPESLNDLTPNILTTLPADPFGAGPYKYRRTEDGCLLYSVARNGVDDGGSSNDEYGFSVKHEGIEIEVSDNDSAPTPEEQALLDRLELIPDGADDESVRFPLPVTPWPWERAQGQDK